MNRTAARVVLGAALALLLAGVLWWWLGGREEREAQEAEQAAAAEAAPVVLPVELHFPADPSGLRVERRQLTTTRAPRDQVRQIAAALLGGPTTPGLVRPLPQEVALGGVVLTADGTAYVDLRWAEHEDPPPAGSAAETQVVYSFVNSIALNVPQAKQVVLLWNGEQRLTFAGHLDTSRPLAPNQALAAR
jgi:hypothetical protein